MRSLPPVAIIVLLFIIYCIDHTYLIAGESQASPSDKPKASEISLVESLRAAWRQSRLESEFKGSYEYQEGVSSDTPDLSAIDSVEVLNTQSRGFVCKKSQLYRISRIYDGDPVALGTYSNSKPNSSVKEERSFLKNMDFDEVTNGSILISYKHSQKNIPPHIQLMKIPNTDRIPGGLACPGQIGAVSPIFPDGGGFSENFPLEPYPPFQPTEFMLAKLGNNQYRLVAKRKTIKPFDSLFTYTIDWNLSYDIPVITRAHLSEERTGQRVKLMEYEVRMTDFRDCNGLRLPARILYLWRGNSFNAAGEPVDKVIVRDWSSEDLGQEAPRNDDFLITFEPDTNIVGLKQPIPIRKRGSLSIIDINTIDLLGNNDPAPLGSSPEPILNPPERTSGYLSPTVLVNITIIICVVSAAIWLRFRNQKSAQ